MRIISSNYNEIVEVIISLSYLGMGIPTGVLVALIKSWGS